MRRWVGVVTIVIFVIALVALLRCQFWPTICQSCRTQEQPLVTAAGILRKVVVAVPRVQLFTDKELRTSAGRDASELNVYFVYGETEQAYCVAPTPHSPTPEILSYIPKYAVFEWNSNISWAYVDSPQSGDRDPIKYYSRVENARQQTGMAIYEESPDHNAANECGLPENFMYVLRSYPDNVYLMGLTFRVINDPGEETGGGQGFGYALYDPQALQFRRYVRRDQLEQQMLDLVTGRTALEADANPDVVQEVYNDLVCGRVITCSAGEQPIDALVRYLGSGDVPQQARGDVLATERLRGSQVNQLSPDLSAMIEQMEMVWRDECYWDPVTQFGFVPPEWLES